MIVAAELFMTRITRTWLQYDAENHAQNYQGRSLLKVFPVCYLPLALLWNVKYQAVLAALIGNDGLRKNVI